MFRNHEPPPVADCAAIRCPVLIAAGMIDPGMHERLPRLAEEISKVLPNCRFQKFESLHHLGPLEDPSQVASSIANWFGQVSALVTEDLSASRPSSSRLTKGGDNPVRSRL